MKCNELRATFDGDHHDDVWRLVWSPRFGVREWHSTWARIVSRQSMGSLIRGRRSAASLPVARSSKTAIANRRSLSWAFFFLILVAGSTLAQQQSLIPDETA